MIITKFKRLNLLIATGFISLSLTGCGSDEGADKRKRNGKAQKVETSLAEIKPVQHKQIVTGSLEAIDTLKLYSEENSRIIDLPYSQGDVVKKGDTLILLDNQLIQADLDKAIAQRQQAKVSLKRLKKLQPKKLASEEEVALAKTALDVAKAEEKRQKARLARTRLTANFDGVISQRHFEPGDVVAANSHISTLINPNSLRVRLQISEQWIALIKINSKVDVRIDALGDQVFVGTISRIYPTIDSRTRKGTVEISLDPKPQGALAGQLSRVTIQTETVNKLVIPSSAIHHDIEGAHVFIVNDKNKVQKTIIQQGLDFGELTEVLSGVMIGDKVVSKGFLGLRHNKDVTIANPVTAISTKTKP